MWRIGRKGRGVIVAAGLIAGAAALTGATPTATADGPVTVQVDYGFLRLSVANSGAAVTFTPAAGVAEPPAQQTLQVSSKCAATPGTTRDEEGAVAWGTCSASRTRAASDPASTSPTWACGPGTPAPRTRDGSPWTPNR